MCDSNVIADRLESRGVGGLYSRITVNLVKLVVEYSFCCDDDNDTWLWYLCVVILN